MSQYTIYPNSKIGGEVSISGSKNSSLPILAATLLSDETSVLHNIPELSDTKTMCELLRLIGADVSAEEKGCIKIKGNTKHTSVPTELAYKLRASFLLIAPLLARRGKVRIPLPGGCQIGARPIDLHIKGFSAMGAKIKQGHGFVELKCKELHPAAIYLDFPSVGATENIMIAASVLDGETVIENAAGEPEISDLASFLCKMGAKISGTGTDKIKITGNKNLSAATHSPIPDRIEAGTFLTIAAITKSELKIKNIIPEHIKPISAKLREMGFEIDEEKDFVVVHPCEKFKTADIKTLPYPGFPTDMQSQFMALLSVAEGTGVVTETVFENRFMHVPELLRMGAKIKVDGRCAIVDGTKKLSGAELHATDLRAGAALVTAALTADGESQIFGVEHIERGYENFDKKLSSIGVKIKKTETV